MGKIAVFLAVGFEEIEAVTVIDILRRAGLEVDVISASGSDCVEGSHGIILSTDKLFYTVDYDVYDMLILPGGMPGTDNLNAHDGLKELLLRFNDRGKHIAAICAAPLVLGELGILDGRDAICYPGFEKRLKGAKISKDSVVRSKNIITGKGAGYADDFAFEILKDFIDEKEIRSLRDSMNAIK